MNCFNGEREIKLREELLNDFGKFLDFIVVKSKDGKIRRFKDYLMSWEITKTDRS